MKTFDSIKIALTAVRIQLTRDERIFRYEPTLFGTRFVSLFLAFVSFGFFLSSIQRCCSHEPSFSQQYIMDMLRKLRELTTTVETWQDVVETWHALFGLSAKITAQRGLHVLECIGSDKQLMEALGAGRALKDIQGTPASVVSFINNNVGAKIRAEAYTYLKTLDKELAVIQRTKDYQACGIGLIGTLIFAAFVSIGDVMACAYYDVLKTDNFNLKLLPFFVMLLLLGCCICTALMGVAYRYFFSSRAGPRAIDTPRING